MSSDLVQAYLDAFGRWDASIAPADFLRISAGATLSTSETILKQSVEGFFGATLDRITQEQIERYAELSPDELDLQLVPHTQELWQSLINPLRLAKKAYALGDFIVTIALTGMVSEMLALVTFEVHGPVPAPRGSSKGRVMSLDQFERLGQEQRIDALRPLLLAERIKEFDLIRKARREYLHFWTKSHSRIREDAKSCYLAAMSLFRKFLDPGIQGTALTLDPQVLAAVKRWQKASDR